MIAMNWFSFLIAALVVWRLTHLLGKEDGPFDIIFLVRKKAGAGFFGNLLDCFYCLSIWVAIPFGIWIGTNWMERIVAWLALSGAACLLEQATSNRRDNNPANYKED